MADEGASQQDPRSGQPFSDLVSRSYPGLKRLAAMVIKENRDGHALASGPTSVLNEALGRIVAQDARPQSEEHLRGLATITLRRVLADRRRRNDADKRGGGRAPVPIVEGAAHLFESVGHQSSRGEAIARVRAALTALLECEPRRGEAMVLFASGGLAVAQIAEVLGVSVSTVERDLRFSRAWICAWIEEQGQGRGSRFGPEIPGATGDGKDKR